MDNAFKNNVSPDDDCHACFGMWQVSHHGWCQEPQFHVGDARQQVMRSFYHSASLALKYEHCVESDYVLFAINLVKIALFWCCSVNTVSVTALTAFLEWFRFGLTGLVAVLYCSTMLWPCACQPTLLGTPVTHFQSYSR